MGASIPDPLFAARVKLEVERRLFGGTAQRLRVGRFEVIDRIGAGGMSVVYSARDPELERTVALKLLQDGARGERLIREARALARLRHPHVVTVYEVGRWNEHLFLAMEHVEGLALGAWREAAPRTFRDVARVMRDVADGLAAVHEIGLVHRDVKPDNIVVDATGAARVLDLGLVADADDGAPESDDARSGTQRAEASLTRPGMTPGTPRYMAPERLSGEPATPLSDQYSFGVTLEEALDGLAPPASLTEIVRRACAEDPSARHAGMRAVRDALERALEPPSRRRTLVLGAAALASAAVVLGLAATPAEAPADPCAEGERLVAEHWGPAQHDAIESASVRGLVDGYAREWASTHRAVCRTASGDGAPLDVEARAELDACLDGRLAALDDAVRTLATSDDALARGADVVAELPPLSDCRPPDPTTADGADPPLYLELAQGTTREDARAAQRTGLRALRDGDVDRAWRSFLESAELDPEYGAPLLWASLLQSHGDLIEARVWFERAYALRAGMGAANRTLLAALAPCIQADPIDDLACEERLRAAAERSPRAAHLWYELARHRWSREGSTPEVVDAFERVVEADPSFVLARFAQGQVLAYLGRFDEALATIDACLRSVPGATSCLVDRIWIRAEQGDCEAVAEDARRFRAAAPTDARAYMHLAGVALSRGDSLVAVAELLQQATDRLPEAQRSFYAARDRALVAIARGDFEGALRTADEIDAAVAHETDRATRLTAPRIRIMVALEVGDRDEAGRLATDALARMEAWTPDPRNEDFGMARDDTPELLDVLRDTGVIGHDERARRRRDWELAWRARSAPAFWPFLWLGAYASTVSDEAEAREALAALDDVARPPFHPMAFADLGLGRMYLFTGHADEAVPILRRAASSCHAPEFTFGLELPWETVRASLDLGRALEETGDVPGACAAYQRVVESWGAAVPRSVTAIEARGRRARLACAEARE